MVTPAARRPANAPVRSRHAQRGMALVIAAIVVAVVIAFAVTVAGGFSRSELRDTYHHNDSVEAMMLAETGLEVALWQLGQGSACGSLAASPYNAAQEIVSGSGKTYQFTNGVTTKFDGSTALPATQCRVQSTGAVSATNVQQTVQAIIDMNLLGGIGNGNFDNPVNTSTTITNWTVAAANVDTKGGPDCSRSLYAFKSSGGGATNATATSASLSLGVTRPATFTVTFDYRVNADAGGATVKVTLNPGAFSFTTATLTPTMTFTTYPTKGTYSGAGCATGYPVGRGSGTINTFGGGGLTITSVVINLNVNGVGTEQQEAWVDNIELVDTTTGTRTALGGWRVVSWHDCRTETCP